MCPVTVLLKWFPFVHACSPQREIPHSEKLKVRVAEENSASVGPLIHVLLKYRQVSQLEPGDVFPGML